MVCIKPNLDHVVSVVGKFIVNLGHAYWKTLKWMLRYLNIIVSFKLVYKQSTFGGESIKGFVDADYAENMNTRKLISEYIFTLFGTSICSEVSLQ